MHKIAKPLIGQCVATARHDDPEGFVELGYSVDSTPIYLSAHGAKDAGEMFGMVRAEDHQAVEVELAETKAELEQAQAELAELRAVQGAIDLLESEGFRSRRKPGPKATA